MQTKRMFAGLASLGILAATTLTGCDDFEFEDLNLDEPTTSSTETQSEDDTAESPLSDTSQTAQDGSLEDAADILYNDLDMNEEQARLTLDALPIEEPRPMTDYSRDDYPHWRSAPSWGWEDTPNASDCDAREAALARDGSDVDVDPDTCQPVEGFWLDPYSGEVVTDSSQAEGEHVVSVAEAHRSGADEWTEEQRTIFANSPLSIVIAGSTANQEKGDKGPEAWRPDNREAWCPYSIRRIAIKSEFGLNLTSTDERDALEDMMNTCGEENV